MSWAPDLCWNEIFFLEILKKFCIICSFTSFGFDSYVYVCVGVFVSNVKSAGVG